MNTKNSREKVLRKIRKAIDFHRENNIQIIEKPDLNCPVFPVSTDPLTDQFDRELTEIGGHYYYSQSITELVGQLRHVADKAAWNTLFVREQWLNHILLEAKISGESREERFEELVVGITGCEFLVAQTGGAIVSSAGKSGRKLNFYPDVHLIIASVKQLTPTLETALNQLTEKYADNLPTMITHIAGPSRTADIEKTLVIGAHGPKELHIFVTESTLY